MTGGKTETAGYGIHLHLALFNARHMWMKAILCWQLLKVLRLDSSSTSVKCVFLSSHGNLLQLSIWDLRMNNNGGCVQRISGSIGDVIYSVCSSPSGLIAIGGTDRAVTIYDPRRLVWFCSLVLMIRLDEQLHVRMHSVCLVIPEPFIHFSYCTQYEEWT